MADIWAYQISANGVSLYKNGYLYSTYYGKPAKSNLNNIVRTMVYLMEIGKSIYEDCSDVEECKSICKTFTNAIMELQERL
jgi:hypothetical protein